ncbi:hypothetical protein [Chamaesiphon polymorphus]|uniref:Uncharacterized protein n=1 Tax=Chamaesiphon polymorphus CCALA 037 TaxID=2107692 RepID=A0A2T1GHZ4_9CYAN|nr:hypothetical protein [Chamaesiphon polymorphus]PSB57345.1 hypothetical protein C7B77_08745 [Chamaesiphon polymorphus CCALA 037]
MKNFANYLELLCCHKYRITTYRSNVNMWIEYALEYNCEIDEDDGKEYEDVMLWPQDVMFHEPWDSGSYST